MQSNRRRGDARPLLLIVAALSAVMSALAWMAHSRNARRAARYHSDPLCATSLATDTVRGADSTRVCSIERGVVASRWIRSGNRSSVYYDVAVQVANRAIDTLEIVGAKRRIGWDAAAPSSRVMLERFADASPSIKHHISAIRAGDVVYPTPWNPDRRGLDTAAGAVVFGAIAIVLVGSARATRSD